ncbi:hypothetical protein Tco_1360137 [Tanacetum coccineum]
MMLIELIKNNDYHDNEEMEGDDDVLDEEEFGGDHFNKFPTRSELAYHNSVIDPRMSPVVLGKPFVELSNMTYDLSLGVVKFTNGIEEIAYKMPYKIEQYDSLSDMEKENTKSVYFRNEEDKRNGVEYVMSKILWFYKECLELGPEYRTGPEESSSRSNVDDQGGVT